MFRQLFSMFNHTFMDTHSLLLKKLAQISEVLKNNYQTKEDIGVLGGISGIALFQFYYSKLIQDESQADLGVTLLTSVIEKINNGYSFHTFCSGIAGAAWAIELLQEEEFVSVDCDELLSGLDDFLIDTIKNMEEDQNFYDFLHGILGIGFYFLKRYQNTTLDTLKNKYKNTLLAIVSLLQKRSQRKGDYVTWESYLIRSEGIKGYNLSLAHGITSILNFLSRLVVYDDFKSSTYTLLHEAVGYILSLKIKDTACTYSYPSWMTTDHKNSETSRLAWCYGDLGVSITLWRVGKALNHDRYKNEALEIVQHAAKRRDLNEAGVKDAGLCHGAYGIMHMYSYMYAETQDPICKEAMDFWMDQALEMATQEEKYAGYPKWVGGEQPVWQLELNLLEGLAGIGLSIISYLAPFKTKWDQCLLIG